VIVTNPTDKPTNKLNRKHNLPVGGNNTAQPMNQIVNHREWISWISPLILNTVWTAMHSIILQYLQVANHTTVKWANNFLDGESKQTKHSKICSS